MLIVSSKKLSCVTKVLDIIYMLCDSLHDCLVIIVLYCLVINPIMVDSFASLFNCTPVVRA